MSLLRVMIVEDDAMQVRVLRHVVGQLGYEVVAALETAEEAEARFDELQPDLLLLDVHLAGEVDGIQLATRLLQRQQLPLIFLTSDHERSTFERALAAGPFAFLTKPFDEDTMLRSIEVAVAQFARQQGGTAGPLPDGMALVPGALYVRENNRLLKIRYDDLLWLEADDSHVHLHTPGRKYTVKISLREMETRLPVHRFVRVRRSAMVQLSHIDHIDLTANTVWVHGVEVPVGRTFRDDLLARLNRVG